MPDFLWPDNVVKATQNRSLVLFVGAGVSASCKNDRKESPPDWLGLLKKLAESLFLDGQTNKAFQKLLKNHQLLDAAELLKFAATKSGRISDFHQTLKTAVEGPQGHPFSPSEWHSTIAALNPRVIITTNYDKILEESRGLSYSAVTYRSPDIDSNIRSHNPTLLKLHGSTDELSSLVLGRSDYAKLHKEGALALSVVQALMTTRTFLFIGYGLSDPDLQALLQDTFATRRKYNTSPHYILVSNKTPQHSLDAMRECYGVSPIAYKESVADYGLSALKKLCKQVDETPPIEF